jgi:PAS domain S-box-containing protein
MIIISESYNGGEMEIYFDKIELVRKKQKISINALSNSIGISRGTYWRWKKKMSAPSEIELSNIAQFLKLDLSDISNLAQRTNLTKQQITESSEIWKNLGTDSTKVYDQEISEVIGKLQKMNKSLSNKMLFINGIMNTSDIAFYAKDINQKYLIANGTFLKNISLSANYEISGKTDEELYSKSESKKNIEQDSNVINQRKPLISAEQYIPGTKKKRWGMISKIPIIDSVDKVIGMVAILTDITEKKKIENINEILAESINSLNASLLIQDYKTGKCLFANERTSQIFGHKKDKFMSWNANERINKTVYNEDRQVFINNNILREANSGKKYLEFRIIKPDNQIRWLRVYYSFLNYMDRIWQISIYRDITEERNREELNKILKLNIDIVSQGIAVRDFETFQTLYENDAYEKIFCCKASHITTQEDFLNSGKWDMSDTVKEKILNAFKNKNKKTEIKYKLTTPNGKTKYIFDQLYIKKIFGKLCYCIVSTDMTFTKNEVKKAKLNIAKELKLKCIDNKTISSATNIDIKIIEAL